MTQVNHSRRRFLTATTTAVGGVGVIAAAIPFLSYWNPSAKAIAAGAPVEVDIKKLAPGARLTVAWRGKPVWIVRRTPKMLKDLNKVVPFLRDPDSKVDQQPTYAQNMYRSRRPEILVMIGLCTHLGCSPSYRPKVGSLDAKWEGGFYCPCHGSKFDLAGRVYKSVPAPTNMEIPPYIFVGDHKIIIGVNVETVS